MTGTSISDRSTRQRQQGPQLSEADAIRKLIEDKRPEDALEYAVDALYKVAGTVGDTPGLRVAVAEAYNNVGMALAKNSSERYTRRDLYEKAIEHTEAAESLSAQPLAAVYLVRGRAHAGLENWEDAAKSLKTAVQVDPRNSKDAVQSLFLLSYLRGETEPSVRRIAANEELLGHLCNENYERAYSQSLNLLQSKLVQALATPIENGRIDSWTLDLARIAAFRHGKDRELATLMVALEDAGVLNPTDERHHPLAFDLTERLRAELRAELQSESSNAGGEPVSTKFWSELGRLGSQVAPVNKDAVRVGLGSDRQQG
jgi:tetratricopeptide (TPR) repeat protein